MYIKKFHKVELHWKIMSTQFRYSGNKKFNEKGYSRVFHLAENRGNFYNVINPPNTNDIIINYLLKNAIIEECDQE